MISWQTTIAEIFPDDMGQAHGAYRDVTIKHLLGHLGGVAGDIEKLNVFPSLWTTSQSTAAQRLAITREVISRPPELEPGTRFFYSNLGYIVAGAMLERVSGVPWEDLIQRELFAPLKMSRMGFGAPGHPENVDQPWGHETEASGRVAVRPDIHGDNPPALGPAGTVHGPLQALAKFAACHLAGARGEGTLLTPGLFRDLHTPLTGDCNGLGWFATRETWARGMVLRHSGSNLRWYATMRIVPEQDFVVIVATNQGPPAGETASHELATTLARRMR